MTTPVGCPSCAAPLSDAASCPSCGLPLTGTNAQRLWVVDQQIAGLEAERTGLLDQLRRGELGQQGVLAAPSVLPTWSQPPKESSPVQVQNTLLTLGALLLAGAGVVFTAVTYRQLGVVGRATILLALTGAAAWAPSTLLRRGLSASAEAVAAVAAVLTVLDAYALRRAGVADRVDGAGYWSVATSVVAGLLAIYSTYVPVRVTRWGAVAMAQLPLPLLLGRVEASAAAASVVLTGQAAADLAVARVPFPQAVRRQLTAFGGLFALVALLFSVRGVAAGQRAAWLGFAALAVVAGTAAWRSREQLLRDAAALPVVPLLAAATWAAARPKLTGTQEPLVPAATAVLALQAVALLPRGSRTGATYGALATLAAILLTQGEVILQALAGPFTWLAEPWTGAAVSSRATLGVGFGWDGTVVTLALIAGAALATATAGVVLERLATLAPVAAGLLVLGAITLPLGLATSYRDGLGLLLLVALVLLGAGVSLLERAALVGFALVAVGLTTMLVAAAWSLADETSTLVVLAVCAGLCAVIAVFVAGAPTALALLLGAAELAAVGAHRGLAADQVGGLLLVAVALGIAVSFMLKGLHRLAAELSAAVVAVAGIACAAADPGWLSWTLAGAGLAALGVSTRSDRRLVGLLGGLLLSASSWVRLADAHVHAPEPYVAPLAAAALAAGLLRRRSHPNAGSWECYATGLGLGLLPSLLRSLTDDTPARGLLLLVVALAVVLVGAQARLQAPLVIGSAVAGIDGLALLTPYATALPRWTLLAGAGLLLVLLGATYEQRLRDLTRLRERYDALG